MGCSPNVERPAPHQPVGRGRILQHRVGDWDEGVSRLRTYRSGGQQAETDESIDRVQHIDSFPYLKPMVPLPTVVARLGTHRVKRSGKANTNIVFPSPVELWFVSELELVGMATYCLPRTA